MTSCHSEVQTDVYRRSNWAKNLPGMSCYGSECFVKTRMHSSRMRTVRSSDGILGGGVCSWGGSVLGGGVCSWGGGCLLLGECLLLGGVCYRGVSAPGEVLLGGVSAQGGLLWGCLLWGVLLLGGVCSGGSAWGGSAPGRCGIPACTEADTPPPCGQTHACKTLTFATSSRTVKNTSVRSIYFSECRWAWLYYITSNIVAKRYFTTNTNVSSFCSI